MWPNLNIFVLTEFCDVYRKIDTKYVNKVLKFVMDRLLDDEYVSRNLLIYLGDVSLHVLTLGLN